MTTVIVFSGLILLLLTGVPIFAALAATGISILVFAGENVGSIGDTVFAHMNKSVLITIPLFVLMAQIMIKAKVIDDLYDLAYTVVGHIRGGLGISTVLSCTVFASISGSSVATALAIGSSAIPQMKKFGYPTRKSLGVVAAGGTLGILIPPSGPMILYAIVADVSIGALFIAGLIPGVLLAIIFCSYCVLSMSKKEFGSPDFAGWQKVRDAVKRSIWAVLMPPLIMGGIYLGIFTAAEAAAVGCVYALFVAFGIYRNIGIGDLGSCLQSTMRISMMVFAIIAAAAIFGHAITIIRVPVAISEFVIDLGLTKLQFIFVVMAMIFILGMFLESIAIILITTPILLPSLMALDINPIWYGVLLMINLELAMITPPVGMNLFVIKGITDSTLSEVMKGSAPYVLLMLLGLLLIVAFPGLATWLPHSAGYGF